MALNWRAHVAYGVLLLDDVESDIPDLFRVFSAGNRHLRLYELLTLHIALNIA